MDQGDLYPFWPQGRRSAPGVTTARGTGTLQAMEQRPDRDEHRDHESDEERLDRELLELLNEVRVAMPGVQVLFGFLLAVPFQQRFAMTTAFQRDVYFATLLCSAAATAFLVMPVAYHRIMFRQRDKPRIVLQGARSIIAGLVFLALAMSGAVLLVTDVIFGAVTTVVATAVVGLLFAWLWFGYASVRRALGKRSW
jgi:VIT1/CCC1 family predicted Fe2+/Mn2+ transporter